MTTTTNPSATTQFDADVAVCTVDGDPDGLTFYDKANGDSWLSMRDPINLRDSI